MSDYYEIILKIALVNIYGQFKLIYLNIHNNN